MANKTKCKDCRHYDVIRSGQTKNPQHGWCAAKSVYPYQEEIGQVFPPGVKRASSPGELAKPEIVEGNRVLSFCVLVKPK